MDTENSRVITRGKGGWEEVEGSKGINGAGRRLDLGCEHTMQRTDDVL